MSKFEKTTYTMVSLQLDKSLLSRLEEAVEKINNSYNSNFSRSEVIRQAIEQFIELLERE